MAHDFVQLAGRVVIAAQHAFRGGGCGFIDAAGDSLNLADHALGKIGGWIGQGIQRQCIGHGRTAAPQQEAYAAQGFAEGSGIWRG
jgi:hypothetical protein